LRFKVGHSEGRTDANLHPQFNPLQNACHCSREASPQA
jgi:hypothetical protein